jgi:ABC-type dipeptide/oligopeptide/nickel transport system permease component
MFLRYAARRLLLTIPVLLAVIFITYGLALYGAGDPVRTLVGQTESRGDEELIERIRERYGYDRPFVVQYADYVFKFATGEWGTSFQLQDQSIRHLILRALPVSFQLGFVAVAMLLLIGIPLGILAAVRRDSWLDRLIVSSAVLADSIPGFVMAPVVLVFLVLKLGIVDSAIGWDGIFSTKVLLPAFVLALGPMLVIVRQTRYAVSEVLHQDYVRTARAKGLKNSAVIWRHVLKNALQPVMTLSGMIAASLVTGSIFIERIFGIPGFGYLVVTALQRNDLPLLMGTTIVAAVIVLLANLIVDLLYAILDPRIRYT